MEGSIEQGIATNAEKDAGEGVDPLNRILDGATLVPEMKKPFDVLADGPVSKISRGDKTAIEPFLDGIRGLPAKIGVMLHQDVMI